MRSILLAAVSVVAVALAAPAQRLCVGNKSCITVSQSQPLAGRRSVAKLTPRAQEIQPAAEQVVGNMIQDAERPQPHNWKALERAALNIQVERRNVYRAREAELNIPESYQRAIDIFEDRLYETVDYVENAHSVMTLHDDVKRKLYSPADASEDEDVRDAFYALFIDNQFDDQPLPVTAQEFATWKQQYDEQNAHIHALVSELQNLEGEGAEPNDELEPLPDLDDELEPPVGLQGW